MRRSVAEVVGPLSGSEKRAIGIVRVESPGATPDARGREPSLGEVGARERVGLTLTKRPAVPRRQSDPHHVNARHSREAAWFAYVLRRVRGCMRLSAMEGVSGRRSALTFHEEARGNGLGGLRSKRRSVTDRRACRRRRQRCQGLIRISSRGTDEQSPRDSDRIAQRSARRETRVPPISLPSTGPEPFGEPSSVLGRERVARLNVARCGHEAQASVREGPPVQIGGFCVGSTRGTGMLEVNWFWSADVGRNASPGRDAREREQRSRKRAT